MGTPRVLNPSAWTRSLDKEKGEGETRRQGESMSPCLPFSLSPCLCAFSWSACLCARSFLVFLFVLAFAGGRLALAPLFQALHGARSNLGIVQVAHDQAAAAVDFALAVQRD